MIIQNCMKQNVFSIKAEASIGDAIHQFAELHVGLLPVIDSQEKVIGVVGLRDILMLAMPSFVRLVEDLDFVPDFGVVETSHPNQNTLHRPITSLMHPAWTVEQDCGLLRAYALMLKHELHDIPVVDSTNRLVGIASRVDIGRAIVASWETSP